jgi:predicted aspartyl protease
MGPGPVTTPASRRRRRTRAVIAVLAALLPTVAACGNAGDSAAAGGTAVSSAASSETDSGATASGATASGATASGSTAIGSIDRSGTAPLQVVGGPHQTLAVAPVTILGTGPFVFLVDTGASRSVVDRGVASRLGLRTGGQSEQVSGVGCSTQAAEATLSAWQVGGVALPKATVSVLDMANGGGSGGGGSGGGLQGLLGSDVLSQFGVVTIDYQQQRLRLGAGAVDLSSGTATTVAVKVVTSHGAVLAVAPVRLQGGGPFAFIVDSGAAMSVVDTAVARRLGLQVQSGGQASGVSCQTDTGTVRISRWAVGNVALPGSTLTTVDLPGSRKGQGLQGLLGSDRLSTFGAVALDYTHQKLLLAQRGG